MKARGDERALVAVKLLHTAIWALMAACVLAIPVFGWARRFDWALGASALVLGECAVLAMNRGRCPLTGVAARYTDNRAENFDIYLPRWLARYNKQIFGTLFIAGEVIVIWTWLG
jgi:hypothetical protein